MGYKKHQAYQLYQSGLQKLLTSLPKDDHGFGCIFGSSEVLIESAISEVKQSLSNLGYQTTYIEASQWVQSGDILNQVNLFDPLNLYIINRCENVRSWPQWFKKNTQEGNALHTSKTKVLMTFNSERLLEPVQKELLSLKTALLPCFDPWPNEFPKLIRDLATKYQLHLTADAIETLIEANGYEPTKLKNEISKLSLIFAKSTSSAPLTRSMISTHLGMLRSEDSFKMDRLLVERSWASAQSMMLGLLDEGEKPISLLGMISYHCRSTLIVETARLEGLNRDLTQKLSGLSSMALNTYANARSKPNISRYSRALKKCRTADFMMKSGRIREDLLLSDIIDTLSGP